MNNYFIQSGFFVKDDSCFEWDPLVLASWYDQKFKKDKIDQEYLAAYLNASKDLQQALIARSHPFPGMTLLRDDQTCMPFLFSCRHLIEITIKYKLKNLGVSYKYNHGIASLWNKLKTVVGNDYNKQFDELIKTFNYTDTNGVGLRFSHDQNDKYYGSEPVSINSSRIMNSTEELYNFIINIRKGKK